MEPKFEYVSALRPPSRFITSKLKSPPSTEFHRKHVTFALKFNFFKFCLRQRFT